MVRHCTRSDTYMRLGISNDGGNVTPTLCVPISNVEVNNDKWIFETIAGTMVRQKTPIKRIKK